MLIIRAERPEDLAAVRRVNELAFGTPAEADLVDLLRRNASPHISLVALLDGQVAGHIFFSPVTIEAGDEVISGMGLAPMAVMPAHQNKGIGGALIREGLKLCAEQGHGIVVVLGHPEYYPRFGFEPASRKGLRCQWDVPDGVFMVQELIEGAIRVKEGLVKYRPEIGRD